jgi:hypothetical protein
MNGSLARGIPDGILRELEKLRPYLERSGGSIRPRKRDGVWCLRIRVDDPDRGPAHRRIKLGDERTADAVRAVIAVWREDRGARDAEEDQRREEAQVYRKRVKELRRQLLAVAGGSSRRRRMAKEFDKAARDPATLHLYLLGGGWGPIQPRRRRRKPRGGLA